jgi:hypothetical protein
MTELDRNSRQPPPRFQFYLYQIVVIVNTIEANVIEKKPRLLGMVQLVTWFGRLELNWIHEDMSAL